MKETDTPKKTRSSELIQKKALSFARKGADEWQVLQDFVHYHCKYKSKKMRERFEDEMCKIVDAYVHLNINILLWCFKNGVDAGNFGCDVTNLMSEIKERKRK